MKTATPLILATLHLQTMAHNHHPERGHGSSGLPARGKREADQQDRPNEDAKFWLEEGSRELATALRLQKNEKLAKNIVIIVGDGMSMSTIAAARVYKGQQANKDGTSTQLVWEKFPNFGLSRTYSVDAMVPDSSSTASAMFSGVKTNYYTVGYDNSIVKDDPYSQMKANRVETVLNWAQDAGMKTGIVTTTRITHATPSALFAGTASRDWECESKMPRGKPAEAHDIATQLVEHAPGKHVDVILGGGLMSFVPKNMQDETDPEVQLVNCSCSRDLTDVWRQLNPHGRFVKTKDDLLNVNPAETEKLFGLFDWSHVPYHDTLEDHPDAPSLSDLTDTALNFLKAKSTNGFFLMVEAGRIDHAHHEGTAVRSLSETLEMDRTVQRILDHVDLEETLVIVTADHSHTMTMGGYPGRTADIGGVVRGDNGWIMKGLDGKSMPILAYANGPGFSHLVVKEKNTKRNWEAIERSNSLADTEHAHFTYKQSSGVPLDSETHGGDDVGIWAAGPMGHLVHATHQQSYIGHVMSMAGCIGLHAGTPRCIKTTSRGRF